MPLDRRSFLSLSLGATLGSRLQAERFNHPTSTGRLLRVPLYSQVAITGGLPLAQQQNAQAILATLDDDALLKPFRVMGNLPAPGRDLGGWYGYLPDYNWHTGDAGLAPGHSFGQWTSAMARFAAAQDDSVARDRVLRLQHLLGESITPAFFDKHRYPAYLLDKLNCGLLDAHALLNAPEAFTVLDKVRQCTSGNLPETPLERDTYWRKERDFSYTWDESYTLPENLYLLWAAGAGESYRTMARTYLFSNFFDPLARNENILGDLHGYSHVNALCSAMQAYFVDGSQKHLQAALNGYRMVDAQTYATGGWAPDELFEKPGSGKLLASLTHSHNTFETPCGTYAFLKLSRYLLQVSRDGRYGDAMERILWNSMFGALPLQPDGRTFYYADVNNSAQRVYSTHRWPCCSGTYPQVAADYGINTYLLAPAGDTGVWVNLYLPSTLTWNEGSVQCKLTQTGGPLTERVSLRLKVSRATRFALRLRIPAWCSSASVSINGQTAPLHRELGFATLTRTWHDGDRIELRLPATLRLEPFPADGGPPQNDLVALCWGPWVLLPLAPAPTARADDLMKAERIGETEWRVRRAAGELYLKPLFAVGDGTYATYVRLG